MIEGLSHGDKDTFVFKSEGAIAPKHPRAFMSELEAFLRGHSIVLDENLEMTAEVDELSDEEVAQILFKQFQELRQIDNPELVKEDLDKHPRVQMLIVKARQLCK